ncbi:hypothetical protein ANCDUO_06259 [Ancylostoma duodenale]|uniref:Uncharacterized protein n=1 Tax=Ancylostoma duodenale TaxID=51022 RepID=A0A0C2DLG4_9BILA|nr:hypothetical protein ANCDUO_06259 [Ancylostoma duodenale]
MANPTFDLSVVSQRYLSPEINSVQSANTIFLELSLSWQPITTSSKKFVAEDFCRRIQNRAKCLLFRLM